MMKKLTLFAVFFVTASSFALDVGAFSVLDREIAGLMDAWWNIYSAPPDEPAALFEAGTALLRAEAAYRYASLSSRDALPENVLHFWVLYLKSSADCICHFRTAVASPNPSTCDDVLMDSFIRWEDHGKMFLEAIKTTR